MNDVELQLMNAYELLKLLYNTCVYDPDSEDLNDISQYINNRLTINDVDDFISVILSEEFEVVIPYLEFLMDVIHRPFPDYCIPYEIIISGIDAFASEHVFVEGLTQEMVVEKYEELLNMIDKDVLIDENLSIWQCAESLLKPKLKEYQSKQEFRESDIDINSKQNDHYKISENNKPESEKKPILEEHTFIPNGTDRFLTGFPEPVKYILYSSFLISGFMGIFFFSSKLGSSYLFWFPFILSVCITVGTSVVLTDRLLLSNCAVISHLLRKIKISPVLLSYTIGISFTIILCLIAVIGRSNTVFKDSDYKRYESVSSYIAQMKEEKKIKSGNYTIARYDGEFLGTAINDNGIEEFMFGTEPYIFYINPTADGSYVIYTNKIDNKVIGAKFSSPGKYKLCVEDYDTDSKYIRFFLKWCVDDFYQIYFEDNNELMELNDSGSVAKLSVIDYSELNSNSDLMKISKAKLQEYKANSGYEFVGRCSISTFVDGKKRYIGCDDQFQAYLTENQRNAVLYEERDTNGNIYFVSVGTDGKHRTLCYTGSNPSNGSRLKFSVGKGIAFGWREMNDGIFCAEDNSYCIYTEIDGENTLNVTLKKIDENSYFGSWSVKLLDE